MRVLILGGGGMLGHKLAQHCAGQFETWVTFRSDGAPSRFPIFGDARSMTGIDAGNLPTVGAALERARPDVVVNCIGVVKQRVEAKDAVASISINALFPHLLAEMCAGSGARLIHLSTDCVFSGRRGGYVEADPPDAEDLYGRTKLLGEVAAANVLTMRTSMIGRELATQQGLVEWFLGRRGGSASGYPRAIFSGFTTLALSRIIIDVIRRWPSLAGLHHVSAAAISKYDLLQMLNDAFATGIQVVPDPTVAIDRSLDCGRFRAATDFVPPSWPEMVRDFAADPTPYDEWRNSNAS
jgi:dTDP-4-dehydrorhamnose reductase